MLSTKQNLRVGTLKINKKRAYHHVKFPIYKGRQKQKKKETMEIQNSWKGINNLTLISPYMLVITLNVSELNLNFKSKGTEWLYK